jgi:hypothetical protein
MNKERVKYNRVAFTKSPAPSANHLDNWLWIRATIKVTSTHDGNRIQTDFTTIYTVSMLVLMLIQQYKIGIREHENININTITNGGGYPGSIMS